MNLNSIIKRHFTKELENSNKAVWDLFQWKKVNVEVNNYTTGEVVFSLKDAEFPEHFSDRACNIVAGNYFRKNVPFLADGKESSYKQVVHRMVSFWVEALSDEGVLIDLQDTQIVYDELCYMMIAQMFAPNSPQWFNTGLNHAYQITGEGRGHFYYDEKLEKVVESEDSYTRTQGSACFITGIQDALLGEKSITDCLTTETRLFKFGSGVGSNFSAIRGEGEKLSGGGKSSGLMSFLKVFDSNAGAIKSGGTTRRAAKMNILNADHPDIKKFVEWKTQEEQKVRDLGKMGYNTDFTGEAYATVSGQNANNSIRFTDEFMEAVKADGTWDLTSRTTGEVVETVKAKELWQSVAECAWACGDPGVQFHDIVNNWNTCTVNEFGEKEEIHGSNPCSEYMFLNDTACNLASLNLMAFVKDELFNVEDYLHCIGLVHLILEATIHWGQFPTEDIARRSYLYRTTGMGYANLGGLLMSMAIPYGSELGTDIGAYLMSLMTAQCYKVSALLAQRVGPFAIYEPNKNNVLNVLNRHKTFATEYNGAHGEISDTIGLSRTFGTLSHLNDTWKDAIDLATKYGVRNAQVTVLAPTGTISFAMDCATTSAEPFFSHIVWKKVVDGSTIQMINPITETALRTMKYSEEEIADIKNHLLQTGSFYGAPYLKESEYEVFKVANDEYSELTVTPLDHLTMMSKLTQQVSGAISKTVNLPNSATVDEVKDVFMKSWEMGIKAITVYRDGSKVSQPLNLTNEKKLEDMTYDELLAKVKELEAENKALRVSSDATTKNTGIEIPRFDKSQSTSKLAYDEGEEDEEDDSDDITSSVEPTLPQSNGKGVYIPDEICLACKTNLKKQLEGDCVPKRHKPEGIRNSNTHAVQIDNIKMYITVSKYANGTPCEIYVSAGKQGSLIKGMLEALSVTISRMLQYGIPVADICKMYRGTKYSPSGFVGGHPYIKMCDSIGDLISKILEIEVGVYTYCQVKPENSQIEPPKVTPQLPTHEVGNSNSKTGTRVYDKVCSKCGSDNMVKAGTCYYCSNCGNSSGGCS